MLHVWLVPLLIFALLILFGFYLIIRHRGGSGVRTDGRTVVDKPDDEPPPEE